MQELKEQIIKVIEYSQGFTEPKVDELLENWMNAKRDFIECFNGKMIYECPFPMTFHLTETAKASRIDNFISYIDSQYDNYALIHFEYHKRYFHIYQK